jgi:hypothetical protein
MVDGNMKANIFGDSIEIRRILSKFKMEKNKITPLRIVD